MRHILSRGLLALLSFSLGVSSANAGFFGCLKPSGCGSYTCEYSCKPTIKEEKVEKDCFDFDEKVICVPPVKLPWHTCCDPGVCGGVRAVRKLTKKKVECGTQCVWEWEARNLCGDAGCKPAYGMTQQATPCSSQPLLTSPPLVPAAAPSTPPVEYNPFPGSQPPVEPAPEPKAIPGPPPVATGTSTGVRRTVLIR